MKNGNKMSNPGTVVKQSTEEEMVKHINSVTNSPVAAKLIKGCLLTPPKNTDKVL